MSVPTRRERRGSIALAILALCALVIPAGVLAAKPPLPAPVEIQLLNVSDWHGQIPPLAGPPEVGGSAALAAYWAADRAANPNTLTLTAGDDFGATPPISSFFQDVPAVLAQRQMGLQVGTFGNHNFDRGITHLQSQVDLAAAPTDADHPGNPYRYVAANLVNLKANLTGVDPVAYFTIAGAKIAVIGIVNEEAPTLVTPGNLGTIHISDGVAAANKHAAIARKAGANAVIVITHKGIRGFDGAGNAFGELIDFADGVDSNLIDVIVGDHTDLEYSGNHDGILVYENRSKGATYARAELVVEPFRGGGVTESHVEFVTPLVSAVTPDPTISAFVAELNTQLQPILGEVVGYSNAVVLRSDACGQSAGRICESRVGNVATDAMRTQYGTDFAITNSGGLRAALTCPAAGSAGFCPADPGPPYPITRGSVIGVLPFGNIVVTLSVTGAEIRAFLENGVSAMPGANGRFVQVSGLCFTYDISAAVGSRVTSIVRQAPDGTCTGPVIDPAATYTLAINDFMAKGGDGSPNVFSRVVSRDLMAQDLEDYVGANTPISPSIQGRIVCTTTGATACPAITAP
jgi:2',3'-cyclic-nucleotide 2'-phosphodiesterase (5'-nucleotidase family)